MIKVKYVEISNPDGSETYAIIDRGNGEFTSMSKTIYDEQQAAAVNDTNEL